MKIGTPIDSGATSGIGLRGTRESGPATPAAGVKPASDQVSLSSAGAQIGAAGSDFDQDKVDAIRQAIRDGRFTVNAGAIADRLIADAHALLGPRAR